MSLRLVASPLPTPDFEPFWVLRCDAPGCLAAFAGPDHIQPYQAAGRAQWRLDLSEMLCPAHTGGGA